MDRLLRRDLGFRGVTITDALDMGALAQGPAQVIDVIAAIAAGVDLLLCTPDRVALRRIEDGLRRASGRALFRPAALRASVARIGRLRRRLGRESIPDLAIVGSAAHRALAQELARRSVTLVRDDARRIPIRLAPGARILAVMPRPRDLTPADTSSYISPGLGAALRAAHPTVDEVVTSHPPTDAEIAAARNLATSAELVVVGTIDAIRDPAQVSLVEALAQTGRPVIAVALRVPFDVNVLPPTVTQVATYSILPESLAALADILVGRARPVGQLPVGRQPLRSAEGPRVQR
jgi:beta-N-acetylhexosaminidase